MEFLENVATAILLLGISYLYITGISSLLGWPFKVIGRAIGKEIHKECICKEHKDNGHIPTVGL